MIGLCMRQRLATDGTRMKQFSNLAPEQARGTLDKSEIQRPSLDDAPEVVRLWARLAKEPLSAVENGLYAAAAQTPAVQSLQRRLEQGGVLSCAGVSQSAQPFLAALLRHLFPKRPVVIVVAGLKAQESFQQDVTTWLRVASGAAQPGESVP